MGEDTYYEDMRKLLSEMIERTQNRKGNLETLDELKELDLVVFNLQNARMRLGTAMTFAKGKNPWTS